MTHITIPIFTSNNTKNLVQLYKLINLVSTQCSHSLDTVTDYILFRFSKKCKPFLTPAIEYYTFSANMTVKCSVIIEGAPHV